MRTAWLYAVGGRNFPHRIIELADERGALSVVSDEVGSPTYTPDLADAIVKLLETHAYGIYHLVNEGAASRLDFAQALMTHSGRDDVPLTPISSSAFKRASTPPPYAPLANNAAAALGIRLRPWEDAVAAFIDDAGYHRAMTEDQAPRVSIIIPNWNGAHHLPVCLDSLRGQSFTDSRPSSWTTPRSDASLEILRRYPEVRVLAQRRNLGFTGACNAGLRAAGGEIQILLNNDTETHPEWVATVVATFDEHPEAGIVASKMLLFDQRNVLHTAGDYVTPDGMAHNRGVWHKDLGQYNRRVYVFSACGGSSAYRRRCSTRSGCWTGTSSSRSRTSTWRGGRSSPAGAVSSIPRPSSTTSSRPRAAGGRRRSTMGATASTRW